MLERKTWRENNHFITSRFRNFQFRLGEETKAAGLKYVISGNESYTVNGRTYTVKPGQTLVINKGRKFDIDINSDTDVKGICIYLDDEVLADVKSTFTNQNDWLLENSHECPKLESDLAEGIYEKGDVLHYFFAQLNTVALMKAPEVNFQEFFYDVTANLLLSQGQIGRIANRVKAVKPGTRNELYKRVNAARTVIEDDFSASMDLKQLAAIAHMSEFHFLRTFRQVFGITPNQYKIRKRLEAARTLLVTTSDSVASIAVKCGFSDIHSFSKSFIKAYAASPGKFRK